MGERDDDCAAIMEERDDLELSGPAYESVEYWRARANHWRRCLDCAHDERDAASAKLALAERANGELVTELQALKERADRHLASCHEVNGRFADCEAAYRKVLGEQAKRIRELEAQPRLSAEESALAVAALESDGLRLRCDDPTHAGRARGERMQELAAKLEPPAQVGLVVDGGVGLDGGNYYEWSRVIDVLPSGEGGDDER